MYVCLVEGCKETFWSTGKRHVHLIEIHRYPKNFDFSRYGGLLYPFPFSVLTRRFDGAFIPFCTLSLAIARFYWQNCETFSPGLAGHFELIDP